MSKEKAKKLLYSAIKEVLVKDEYASKETVLAHLDILNPMIEELVFTSLNSVIKDLCLLGYSEELATLSALNIVGKVVVFEALFLLRQNAGTWLPEGFVNLPPEQRAVLMQGILDNIRKLCMPAIGAYEIDEQLDNAIPHADKLGGYANTALGVFLSEVKNTFENVDPSNPNLAEYKDPSKTKISKLVDLYMEIYRAFEKEDKERGEQLPGAYKKYDQQHDPELLMDILIDEGLAAFYQQYQFVGLLAQAWIHDESKCSDEEIKVRLKEAILPMADVIINETLGAWIAKLLHGSSAQPYKKVPLPLPFADALYIGLDMDGSDMFMHDVYHGLYLTSLESQGLVMVANILHIVRGYAQKINVDTTEVAFVRKPGYEQLSFSELLSKDNQNLRDYIKVLQFLVRLSDDIGDYFSDKETVSPNLLLLLKEFRHHLVGGTSLETNKDDDDVDPTRKITPEQIIAVFRREAEEMGEVFDEVAVRKQLDLPELLPEEGYLESLGKRMGLNLAGLMNELYAIFDKGGLAPEEVNVWIGRLIEVLDQAKAKVMEEESDSTPADKWYSSQSYKDYVIDLYEIARGAILIGTKINDAAFTADAQGGD